MFTTKRALLNPKFEGYKLDLIAQDDSVARHQLQYTLTQATVSTNSLLSFHEVQSRITHNHLAVAPHGSGAVYVDAQYRVILKTLNPSFRAVYELPQPIQSQNGSPHREYPSAVFLSSTDIIVSDGSGLLYILRDGESISFQLLGVYELPQHTPFRIHHVVAVSPTAAVVILSSRNYTVTAQTASKRQVKAVVDFDVWAINLSLPLASSGSGGVQPLAIVWQRRGHAVPIHVAYDESRHVFMLLGDSVYGPVGTPVAVEYSPSAEEIAPIPRPNEKLDGTFPDSLKPPPYSWTQTSDSVTVVFPLPSTTPKTDIKVAFSQQSLTLHVQGNIAPDMPLPHYSLKRLWDGISASSSMWTWDREGEHHVGLLTLHLDKQHEGTKWPHVFASSGTSVDDAEVTETLDPSELWNIRESLEKYTAALRTGDDASGSGLGNDLPSLAKGEMDDEVDLSIGRVAQLTWVGVDGSNPRWASQNHDLPNRLLSTELPGSGSGCSLVVKNGLDGTLFSFESASNPEEPPNWVHTSTFSALSFVLASKTDTRFTYHIDSRAVFAFENGMRDRAGNVYIYRAASATEKWAKQAVLRVGQQGSLLGVGALQTGKENVLLCLTETELILINNIQC
ncbi:hypothetical protein C8R43DRAFT_1161200 [Mycena crocata]|nr:hypothetical protein C8R43DRAFT_1161200 [Mycena crocata]